MADSMTETSKLRDLLDERGVEWTKVPDETAGDNEYLQSLTYWGDIGEQGSYVASEVFGGLKVDPLTAQQAVAATLGHEPPANLYAVSVWDELGGICGGYVLPELHPTIERAEQVAEGWRGDRGGYMGYAELIAMKVVTP